MAMLHENRGAVELVFRTHRDELLRTIAGYVRHCGSACGAAAAREMVDEAYSQTALTALERVDTFNPEIGVALAWVKGIAFQKVRGLVRDRARRCVRETDPWLLQPGLDPSVSWSDDPLSYLPGAPVDTTAIDDTAERVAFVLGSVGPADRELLHLYYLEGVTLVEIAELRGINPGAVYTRLSRVRAGLRRDFAR